MEWWKQTKLPINAIIAKNSWKCKSNTMLFTAKINSKQSVCKSYRGVHIYYCLVLFIGVKQIPYCNPHQIWIIEAFRFLSLTSRIISIESYWKFSCDIIWQVSLLCNAVYWYLFSQGSCYRSFEVSCCQWTFVHTFNSDLQIKDFWFFSY